MICSLIRASSVRSMAPRHGFEPRFTAPKAAVLPLDDRGMIRKMRYSSSLSHLSKSPEEAQVGTRDTGAGANIFASQIQQRAICCASSLLFAASIYRTPATSTALASSAR